MLDFEIVEMTTAIPAIIGGLVILLGAGELLVKGSIALASKLGIPPLIISMTIVAFGTSVPELFIGIQSVLKGSDGLAVGNVVGSNIANVLLVLGVPSILYPTLVKEHGVRRNTSMMIGAALVLIALAWDGRLSMFDGATLVFLLVVLFGVQIHHAKSSPGEVAHKDELAEIEGISDGHISAGAITAYMVFGLLGLPLGANMLVSGSVFVAEAVGVSEAIIGLSLVAIGTSLPELAIAVVATMRRHASVAIGNVIGSNVLNIAAVMGITTLVAGSKGIEVPEQIRSFDLWVMLASSLILVPLAFSRKGSISRTLGIVFLVFYIFYIYWIFRAGMIG